MTSASDAALANSAAFEHEPPLIEQPERGESASDADVQDLIGQRARDRPTPTRDGAI